MAGHAPAQQREQLSKGMLGFILFLASEVMFFGGLFAAYFIARADAPEWPPESLLTAEQIASGVHLELGYLWDPDKEIIIPLIGTIILVSSSFVIQWGVFAIQKGNRTGLIWSLFITLAMGLVFLTLQLYDYSLLAFGADDTVFGTTFYTLTGFHGAHVTGGALFIFIVLMRSLGGQFDARNHEAVEACSMYWHFVDVVWIALFVILYAIPS
jgi:cytochrome c oxidase subunit 3